MIYLLKEEKFGLWRNIIPCRKVKVNCYPKLVVNWEVGTPISTLFYVWLCGTQVTGMWSINFGFRNKIMRDSRWSSMPYSSSNLFCRLFMLRLMRRASFRCVFLPKWDNIALCILHGYRDVKNLKDWAMKRARPSKKVWGSVLESNHGPHIRARETRESQENEWWSLSHWSTTYCRSSSVFQLSNNRRKLGRA